MKLDKEIQHSRNQVEIDLTARSEEEIADLCDKTGLYGARGMDAAVAIYLAGGVIGNDYSPTFCVGYGAAETVPSGMKAPGYVATVQFLQEVAPLYAYRLGLDAYGVRERSSTSSRLEGNQSFAQGDPTEPQMLGEEGVEEET